MSYQTPRTIFSTLEEIRRGEIVLPAIQRELVWSPDQICKLFDSLMQGYPFGVFLYWLVRPESSREYKFYDFILDYHQRDHSHNQSSSPMPNTPLKAVLDGQQRLTALNIGLRGSMALKLPRMRWNNPDAFPLQELYLDLLWQPGEDNEEGLSYRFNFLTDEYVSVTRENECWFPVKDILDMELGTPMIEWLNDRLPQEHVNRASQPLFRLYNVVHTESLITYYEEEAQELEKVLQIFIRMNSGGTPLSYSDLLLSIAVAQWTRYDAREEIHALVDDLNRSGNGFSFSKDLILKASLMLSDVGRVGFKVENFNRENMSIVEDKWEDIKRALTLTAQLISNFGFNERNITAPNSILPIAYYLMYKQHKQLFLSGNQFDSDRNAIREWLIRSLLKSGIWSGGAADGMLTAIREIIKGNDNENFPVAQIYDQMARRGRGLTFEDEEIEDLADMQYGNRLTFALLSLLFPHVDLRNHFHVDHIFPKAQFTRRQLDKAGIPDDKIDEFVQNRDGLANLQLLQGNENTEKSASMPSAWLKRRFSDPINRQEYQDLHLLGEIPTSISEFDSFYEDRRNRLKERIEQLLGK